MDARGSAKMLRRGDVYVVEHVVAGFVYLRGVPHWRPGFWQHRFRRSTDISDLTALLVEQGNTNRRELIVA